VLNVAPVTRGQPRKIQDGAFVKAFVDSAPEVKKANTSCKAKDNRGNNRNPEPKDKTKDCIEDFEESP
jgi:hypothetical protein